MDSEALVNKDINDGARLIEKLDQEDFQIRAAFWYFFPESGTWKFVISSPKLSKDPIKAYSEIAKVFSEMREQDFSLELSDIKILAINDPLVQTLSKVMHVEGISQVRFSKNMINGIFIDDALIYRSAA